MKYFLASSLVFALVQAEQEMSHITAEVATKKISVTARTSWFQLKGRFVDTSIDFNSLWAVDRANNIFWCENYQDCDMKQIDGSLSKISTNNGVVCGVNSADSIFCSMTVRTAMVGSVPSVSWIQIPGALIEVTVDEKGSLMGVNRANEVMWCEDYKNCNLQKVDSGFSRISARNELACGIEASTGQVQCSSTSVRSKMVGSAPMLSWEQVSSKPSDTEVPSFADVSVNNDGSLWGISLTNRIFYCYYWKLCKWTKLDSGVNGGLSEISSVDGAVCGTNSKDDIWCSYLERPQN